MAFLDILNKGKETLKNGIGNVKNSLDEKRSAIEAFENLKNNSEPLVLANKYEIKNENPQKGRETFILNAALSINRENINLINNLIGIDETILSVILAKEEKTNIDYLFALTDKKLWIINQSGYILIDPKMIKIFEIVNKGVLSQGVNFENRAFTMEGSENDINAFISKIKDEEKRNALILEKTSYLCGVIPKIQLLNKLLKGVTIGNFNELVIHDHPHNEKINIKDIETMQLLVNDNVAYIKGKTPSTSLTSPSYDARKMSVKIYTATHEYVIEIMPINSLNTIYKREDSVYIENYEFGKKIIDTIYDLIKEY